MHFIGSCTWLVNKKGIPYILLLMVPYTNIYRTFHGSVLHPLGRMLL